MRKEVAFLAGKPRLLNSARPVWVWSIPKWWLSGYYIWWRNPRVQPMRWQKTDAQALVFCHRDRKAMIPRPSPGRN